MDLAETVAILKATPRALRSLLGGLAGEWTAHSPAPGSWSAHDVLAHLVHGERTDWVPRTRLILAHGPGRTFEPFDREGWSAERARSPQGLLDEFSVLRDASVREIEERLTADDLAREGTHPEFGRVTLGQMLATWAVHDLAHLAQIAEAMAKRYRSDIGPWRAYLPIVDRPDTIGD